MEPQRDKNTYGARVYGYDDGVILVKQTVKSGREHTDDYVIDGDKEKHVDPGNDATLAQAIRDALAGRL